jgi:hypothetical protein
MKASAGPTLESLSRTLLKVRLIVLILVVLIICCIALLVALSLPSGVHGYYFAEGEENGRRYAVYYVLSTLDDAKTVRGDRYERWSNTKHERQSTVDGQMVPGTRSFELLGRDVDGAATRYRGELKGDGFTETTVDEKTGKTFQRYFHRGTDSEVQTVAHSADLPAAP